MQRGTFENLSFSMQTDRCLASAVGLSSAGPAGSFSGRRRTKHALLARAVSLSVPSLSGKGVGGLAAR